MSRLHPLIIFVFLPAIATGQGPLPPAYLQVADEQQVPPPLLYAVALVESQIRLTSGAVRPWPWTLNVKGLPERHPTRQAAWVSIRRHLGAGQDSIDIGPMQINWRWHRDRLGDPWRALDPLYNLRTGARILREQYAASGDWLEAAGRYHAPGNPTRAHAYRERVARELDRLGGLP